MELDRQNDFADIEPSYLYRTKDFRGHVTPVGIAIEGTHRAACEWLDKHAGDNRRAQFMHEDGALVAADHVELQALIACLQKEFMQ